MIGRTLNGIYRVSERVAGGGFADFYLGRDLRTNTIVGLKVLHAHLARQPEAARRFFAEARAVQSLDSPHIVRVLDTGEDSDDPDVVLYIAMEYVEGHTLAEHLARGGMLSAEEAVRIARQILRGLEAAHRAGVIHRDVKPQNVIVAPDGTVKIADFGIARLVGEEASPETPSDSLIGTAPYVSPEQIGGRVADARSDLYAVAAVLFEMLAGRPPFDAPETSRILQMHATAPAPRLSQFRDDLPVGLVEAVARGLEKSPDRRYGSAAEFREALGLWERPTRALRPPVAAGEPPDLGRDRPSEIERTVVLGRTGGIPPRRPARPQRQARGVPSGGRAADPPEPPRRRGAGPLAVISRAAAALAVVAAIGVAVGGGLIDSLIATVEDSRPGAATAVAGVIARATSARAAIEGAADELADQSTVAAATATARADARSATAHARDLVTALAEDETEATGAGARGAAPPASARTSTPVPATVAPAQTRPALTSTSTPTATPARSPTRTPAPRLTPTPPRATPTMPRSTATASATATARASTPTVTATSTPSLWSTGTPAPIPTSTATPLAVPSRRVVREYPERTAGNPAEVCRVRQWSDGTYEKSECQIDPTLAGSSDEATRRVVREYPERTAGNPAEVCVVRQWSDGSYEKGDCRIEP